MSIFPVDVGLRLYKLIAALDFEIVYEYFLGASIALV